MTLCRTYEEAKLDAISLISQYNNYPYMITIKPHKEGIYKWAVGMEEFEYDKITELEEKGYFEEKR